jgi:FKBP-type peptidyl-prolyl cis-trans isomerase FkpA
MKNYSIMAVLLAAVTLFSCGDGKKKTERGLEYIYRIDNKGTKPKKDDVVQFHLAVYNAADSLLGNTRTLGPGRPFVHKISDDAQLGMLEEGMKLCGINDSLTFFINSDSLPAGFIGSAPNTLLRFEMMTVKVQTEADFMAEREAEERKEQEEMMSKMDAQKPVDEQIIKQYVADNKMNVKNTASGLYYTITKAGSGKSPAAGATVKVHYTGMLLDGTKFDSSIERGEPIAFPLGEGRVIPGWDEGIALLNKGAKATFIIPSHLAYGARGAGQLIKPFSVLKFEVELVSF